MQVLGNCELTIEGSVILLRDRFGRCVATISPFDSRCTIFKDYEYAVQIEQKLKETDPSIDVLDRELHRDLMHPVNNRETFDPSFSVDQNFSELKP